MLRQGQCPNAIDALKICWYLNVTVDEIFGDTAEVELAKVDTDEPIRRPVKDSMQKGTAPRNSTGRRPPPDHTAHAETALRAALQEKRELDAKIRRLGSKKSTGKKRTG